jgi:hypothetical protein
MDGATANPQMAALAERYGATTEPCAHWGEGEAYGVSVDGYELTLQYYYDDDAHELSIRRAATGDVPADLEAAAWAVMESQEVWADYCDCWDCCGACGRHLDGRGACPKCDDDVDGLE